MSAGVAGCCGALAEKRVRLGAELVQATLTAEVVRAALVVDVPHRVVRGDGHPADGVEHLGGRDSSVIVRMRDISWPPAFNAAAPRTLHSGGQRRLADLRCETPLKGVLLCELAGTCVELRLARGRAEIVGFLPRAFHTHVRVVVESRRTVVRPVDNQAAPARRLSQCSTTQRRHSGVHRCASGESKAVRVDEDRRRDSGQHRAIRRANRRRAGHTTSVTNHRDRALAAYVGVTWERNFGETRELAQTAGAAASSARVTFGVRAWF